MENIESLLLSFIRINEQIHLLTHKNEEMIERARNILTSIEDIGQHTPGSVVVNVDLCPHNQLMQRTDRTADAITKLNGVCNVLLASTRELEKDVEKIKRKFLKRARVQEEDGTDDDISYTSKKSK